MTGTVDPRNVMVIYGHDTEANDVLFGWLRAIGLRPREWQQLIADSGSANPFIGQVLDKAFEQAQAVVALFTPDEHVIATGVSGGKREWRLQARPNVLIEAGMALASHPDRTVLVVLGEQELPSDLAGRSYVRLRPGDVQPLYDLARRLKNAGCDTDLDGSDWLTKYHFPDRDHVPRAHTSEPPRRETVPAEVSAPRASRTLTEEQAPTAAAAPVPPSALARPYRFARALTGHAGPVCGVAFSPDGKLLVTASEDCSARLWEVASGASVRTVARLAGAVHGVAFSPDGSVVAVVGEDASVQLMAVRGGGRSVRLPGVIPRLDAVAFSPDGSLLATASAADEAVLWDVATGGQVRSFGRPVTCVAFSPDGTLLATSAYDSFMAAIWAVDSGSNSQMLFGHSDQLTSVAFSPDGRQLATASVDKTARLWDVAAGKALRTFEGHTNTVYAVAFSPDGTLLATASYDKSVRLWDATDGKPVRTLTGHTSAVRSVAFSPDGALIATAGDDRTARLWS